MRPVNVADYRELARRRLPRLVFDYLEGGSEDEITLRRNRQIFEEFRLVPRLLNDVARRQQGIKLFDEELSSPLVIAPTGLNGLFWKDADIALARAAANAGIPFVLSTAASATIEQVSEKAGGNLWFQLYIISRSIADTLVGRALACGYKVLVLTVDVPVSGKRERDQRNGFAQPFKLTPGGLFDVVSHPRWLYQIARFGAPQLRNLASAAANDANAQAALLSRAMDASFCWDDLKRLRDRWPHILLVKGFLNPEDAVRAVDAGANGVILSNHGGRQLDGTLAPLEALLRTTLRARTPVLVDSGFRRGSDIVKALALGASAVMLGRATLYGLAAKGEYGVSEVVRLLMEEIDRVLALVGCDSATRLNTDYLDLPGSSRGDAAASPGQAYGTEQDPAETRSQRVTAGREGR